MCSSVHVSHERALLLVRLHGVVRPEELFHLARTAEGFDPHVLNYRRIIDMDAQASVGGLSLSVLRKVKVELDRAIKARQGKRARTAVVAPNPVCRMIADVWRHLMAADAEALASVSVHSNRIQALTALGLPIGDADLLADQSGLERLI